MCGSDRGSDERGGGDFVGQGGVGGVSAAAHDALRLGQDVVALPGRA